MSAQAATFERLPGVSANVYAQADFERVCTLVGTEAGIVLTASKAMLVYSRLAPLVRASGAGTFGRYLDLVDADPAQRQALVGALTTNHTAFYREGHHFKHFAKQVRPALLRRLSDGGAVRLWSAACSTGEEPWSMLFTLFGADGAGARAVNAGDLVLLATDLADHALQRARAATYPAETLAAVPPELTRAWTVASGQSVTIAEDLRSRARFRSLNLLRAWPMTRPFDVIFCRNVMIYFDAPTKERLLERLANQLAPGGYLYIGHSERVSGPATALLQPIENTVYRRVAA